MGLIAGQLRPITGKLHARHSDKRLATCRDRFANAINFQGFPHMPGNDTVMRPAPGSDHALDGGSLYR
jgi:hypothetical protein